MAEMSSQVIQKSALIVVLVAQTGKGQTSESRGVNPELEELHRKQKTYQTGKAILKRQGWKPECINKR
jgi:hypothetical protein